MKIIKTASGKKQIKISKKEWQTIGAEKNWTTAADDPWNINYADKNDPEWITAQLKKFVTEPGAFWDNMQFQVGESFKSPAARQAKLKEMLLQLKAVEPTLDMLSKQEQKHIAQSIMKLKGDIAEEDKFKDKLQQMKNEEEPEAQGFLNNDPVGAAPAGILEPLGPAAQPEPEAQPVAVEEGEESGILTDKSFANPRQITEIKNQLLDRFQKKEITEDQLKMVLREFAKKYNQRFVVSFSKGQVKIASVEEDKDGFRKEACQKCKSLISILDLDQGTCEPCRSDIKDDLTKDLAKDK